MYKTRVIAINRLKFQKNFSLAAIVCLAASMPLTTSATKIHARTITFKNACEPGTNITIAAVGDLLFHKKLLLQAFRKGGNFKKFWAPVQHILKTADLTYGNLEGPAAKGLAAGGRRVRDPGRRVDYRVYGYRLPNVSFNYHPSVIDDLKQSGFDIISTANNHAMDRGRPGIDQTIDNFEKVGLKFTGTRKQNDDDRPWSTVTTAKDISIAWLACTYSTNGLPDKKKQILRCYLDKAEILAEIKHLSGREDIHAVILTPHWGNENSHHPNRRQKTLAREAIDAGAAAVIGTHAHVLQPWEKHQTEDGREGLIIYSTGNFISNQRRLPQRTGIIAMLEFHQNPQSKKARITAAGFIPTWVVIGGRGHRVIENRGTMRWALNHAKKILPRGNLVKSENLPRLKKHCQKDAPHTVAIINTTKDKKPKPEKFTKQLPGPSNKQTIQTIEQQTR